MALGEGGLDGLRVAVARIVRFLDKRLQRIRQVDGPRTAAPPDSARLSALDARATVRMWLNAMGLPTPARPGANEARTFVEAWGRLAAAVRGYCQGEMVIVQQLTNLQAYRRAFDVGDLQRLGRLSLFRRNLVESPLAMSLHAAERELAQYIDLRTAYSTLTDLEQQSGAAQERWAALGQALIASGGPNTDADVQAWQQAAMTSMRATLDFLDAKDRVVLGAIGEWLQEGPPTDAAPAQGAMGPDAAREPAPRELNRTEKRILAHCRRKAHTGERIAYHLGLSFDHVRRVLARLVKEARLRVTEDGYRTVGRAT
jgi:hypothetical protein